MNKLKDVAGLLKAKVTNNELQEALINATSQQNWQASTHILHEIANAAYNFQKWQQINEFIWDKLKKGKSWRKVLKTLNLVEFLLKNGPPSIISSFKYDVYQFRSFDNYSQYEEGLDRGQAIRDKAKVVVELLSNQEMLQEERLKAKTIRERMSGVVSGSSGMGMGSSMGGGSKYGSVNSKNYSTGGYSGSDNTNYNAYGSGLGTYGDYNYDKSTLSKYKDKPNTTGSSVKPSVTNVSTTKVEQKKEPTENKKPFETVAKRLVKPGAKPAPKPESIEKQTVQQGGGGLLDDDILGNDIIEADITGVNIIEVNSASTTTNTTAQPSGSTAKNNTTAPSEFGFDFGLGSGQSNSTPQQHQQQYQQPQQPHQQPQQQTQQYQQPQQQYQLPQQQYQQPQQQFQPQQFYQQTQQQFQPQQYQQPQQFYQQPQQQYQQPQQQYQQPQQQYQQQSTGYGTPQTQQSNGSSANFSISLNTGSTQKKEEDEFGNFSSGQTNNVKWLSNDQKGLIDFSDFGDEMKKDSAAGSLSSQSKGNGVDMSWNW